MIDGWGAVVGWEGTYEVSDQGAVRRVGGELLSPLTRGRYLAVNLSRSGRRETVDIHRLMAEAFIPNPDALPLVRHLDDVGTNNVLRNLAWGDYAQNGWDSVQNGGHHLARRTSCANNHEYTEENTRLRKNPRNGRDFRVCRSCSRAYGRARDARQRGMQDA